MALNMIGLENFIVLQYSKLEGLTDEVFSCPWQCQLGFRGHLCTCPSVLCCEPASFPWQCGFFEDIYVLVHLFSAVNLQVLGDLVDQYLTMKAEENKKTIAGKYEKGTAVTHIMVAAGLQQFHQDSSTEECSICLVGHRTAHYVLFILSNSEIYILQDELKGKVCRQTNCVHVFHAACVIEWLEKAPTCPVCRMWALGPAFQFPSWIRNLGILRDFLVNRHSVRR